MLHERPTSRRANRLSYWNYGWPGWYFLTFCCFQGQCLFGAVRDGDVMLSELGKIAQDELLQSMEIRAELWLDRLVIMPNHIHLIAVIGGSAEPVLRYGRQPGVLEARSASSFVSGYKSSVTSKGKKLGIAEEVWHRSFHDHITRTDDSLRAIRKYILENPLHWEMDRLHPNANPNRPDEIDHLLTRDTALALPW